MPLTPSDYPNMNRAKLMPAPPTQEQQDYHIQVLALTNVVTQLTEAAANCPSLYDQFAPTIEATLDHIRLLLSKEHKKVYGNGN